MLVLDQLMLILMVLRLRVGWGWGVRVEDGEGGWLYEEGNGNTVTGFQNLFFRL